MKSIKTNDWMYGSSDEKFYAAREMNKWRYWAACRRAERTGGRPPSAEDYNMPKMTLREVVECDVCGDGVERFGSNVIKLRESGRRVLCAECARKKR